LGNIKAMELIELHVKCVNDSDDAADLREMGIDTPIKTDYRPLSINPDHIIGFYPDTEGGCFMFIVNGDELTIQESYKEVQVICNHS